MRFDFDFAEYTGRSSSIVTVKVERCMRGGGEASFGVQHGGAGAGVVALGIKTGRGPIPIPMIVTVGRGLATAATPTMFPGSVHRQINQPIRRIPPFRTLVSHRFKMCLHFPRFAREYHLSLCEEDETVKEGDDVRLGLVDGKDDGAFVPLGECVQGLNDVLGVVRVEPGSGFVEE